MNGFKGDIFVWVKNNIIFIELALPLKVRVFYFLFPSTMPQIGVLTIFFIHPQKNKIIFPCSSKWPFLLLPRFRNTLYRTEGYDPLG